MTDFREKLKNNSITHRIGKSILDFRFNQFDYCLSEIKAAERKIGANWYTELAKFQNLHVGEKCFIVCTGPSLTYSDLDMIAGQHSFGMNSIIRGLSNTVWKPTYYGIQDIEVYKRFEDDLLDIDNIEIFIADRIKKNACKIILEKNNVQFFPLNTYGHGRNLNNPKFKYSNDITESVYDGYSITYSLIQIACYMGFSEIFIIGCDNNYSMPPEKQHFISNGYVDSNANITIDFQRKAFTLAKEYADAHGIKIYNATRGGSLEVYSRIALEDAVGRQ